MGSVLGTGNGHLKIVGHSPFIPYRGDIRYPKVETFSSYDGRSEEANSDSSGSIGLRISGLNGTVSMDSATLLTTLSLEEDIFGGQYLQFDCRESRYVITRIMVFFKNTNSSSGSDLSYTRSYASILSLGLAAGDIPDTTDTTSGPNDRAACSKFRTTIRGLEDYPRTYTESSGGLPEEKAMPPRV
ncbi:hypothetical protein F511_40630 [Dorcoceras hygrometricum]|uniref:Uncharacterized protein n=1 Tax=Dorcoceras hygrometricum TaxID=472368 RepID=A0A2Z7BGG2_9LAMI|nr:hypothetical protein F511_40630 [Dorcoceras hygrometricum]